FLHRPYTTLMTTADRLHRKGLLSRAKKSRPLTYIYSPGWSRRDLALAQTERFLARFSGTRVIQMLIDNIASLDPELLIQLEERIQRRRAEFRSIGEPGCCELPDAPQPPPLV